MEPQKKEALNYAHSLSAASSSPALITIFSIPKPFLGFTNVIQRNAINSWKNLGADVEVILIGDEALIAETAIELGTQHFPSLQRNEHGTPLVSSAFNSARELSDSPILVYCNCDVILMPDFVVAIKTLMNSGDLQQFVAIARRTDLLVNERIDFTNEGEVAELTRRKEINGKRAAIVCKEFFAFPRNVYPRIPDFAVGRGNWDNWMVASARNQRIPIVDIAPVTTVIHQNHDYQHVKSGRLQCYVTGAEALHNQKLAGGRNLIRGSSSTWILTEKGLHQKKLAWANLDFWRDLIPFMRLVLDLLISR